LGSGITSDASRNDHYESKPEAAIASGFFVTLLFISMPNQVHLRDAVNRVERINGSNVYIKFLFQIDFQHKNASLATLGS